MSFRNLVRLPETSEFTRRRSNMHGAAIVVVSRLPAGSPSKRSKIGACWPPCSRSGMSPSSKATPAPKHAAVTVNVSEPHSNAVTVNYSTANGTATAGSDYNAVERQADLRQEPDEQDDPGPRDRRPRC